MTRPTSVDAPLWRVASPYFTSDDAPWLDRFVSAEQHRFSLVPRVGEQLSWHERRSAHSTLTEWGQYRKQASNALAEPSDGLIGIFPQLAASVGGMARLKRDDRPVVSWFFNTTLTNVARRSLARTVLTRIDKFVVHSTVEIEAYSTALGIAPDRFEFVPLQYGERVETEAPGIEEPFIFATGSGFRDYGTFFEAVGRLGYRTLVLAGPRALEGLQVPNNVEIVDAMDKPTIRRHTRHARVNAVPMATDGLTAGIVTLVETFRHGRAVVATKRTGLEDYLFEDKNCLLAKPHDVDSLASTIEAYWSDESLRRRLDDGAKTFADENCTDEAAAASLVRVLDETLAGSRANPFASAA